MSHYSPWRQGWHWNTSRPSSPHPPRCREEACQQFRAMPGPRWHPAAARCRRWPEVQRDCCCAACLWLAPKRHPSSRTCWKHLFLFAFEGTKLKTSRNMLHVSLSFSPFHFLTVISNLSLKISYPEIKSFTTFSVPHFREGALTRSVWEISHLWCH